MTGESSCARFIQVGEKFEKKLYLFMLLQLGNQAAASEAMAQALAARYRHCNGYEDEKAFEMGAFETAFEMCAGLRYAPENRRETCFLQPAMRARIAGLQTFARAVVILRFFCRFSAGDTADILHIPVERVRDVCLNWLEAA